MARRAKKKTAPSADGGACEEGGALVVRWRRAMQASLVAAAATCALAPALAQDDEAPASGQATAPANPFYTLDTKNLFGFLEGADVGEKGDRSVEFETNAASGKPQGLYDSIEQEFIFESTLTDSLGLELGAHALGQDVQGVAGLPDFAGVSFLGLSVELRYAVIHRSAVWPIQVTLTAEPEWNAVGEAGQSAVDFNTTFRAIADVISPDRRLYGAVNVVYAPDGSRLAGQPWQDSAIVGASAAVSYRVTPPLMFGAEADYDRAYGGLGLQNFHGQAVYLGPTFHYQINEKIDLSAAFLTQAATGVLDLGDFPRRLAKLRLEVDF